MVDVIKKRRLINVFVPLLLVIVLTACSVAALFAVKDYRGKKIIYE
jgi:hypothetical protein